MSAMVQDSDSDAQPASRGSLDESANNDLTLFNIGLFPTGDAGSGFRTQNDPNAPYQRGVVIDRPGVVEIRCTCLDVVHGRFSCNDASFATLLVMELRLDARKKARRFEAVNMTFQFRGMNAGDSDPEVYAIVPDGHLSLVPTIRTEKVHQKAEVHLGGSVPTIGVEAKGLLGWQKTFEQDKNDHTTVIGSRNLRGRNWGKPDCASWTLLENQTSKTGVPKSMRVAILLKRRDQRVFQCIVEIDVKVDLASSMERGVQRLFGRKDPKDDPILFQPMSPSSNNLMSYDVENLGTTDLNDIADVTVSTELLGAIKARNQNPASTKN